MSWNFEETSADGHSARTFPVKAQKGQTLYLAKISGSWLPQPNKPDERLILGVVKFETWGARLEARNEPLIINPAGLHMDATGSTDPSLEAYVLQPSVEGSGQSEVILLRNNDVLQSRQVPGAGIALTWVPPEILVNSSETPNAEVPDCEDTKAAPEGPEDMTKDDDKDLDQSVKFDQTVKFMQSGSSRTTPLPSACTDVVQETPHSVKHHEPPREAFFTAPTKQHTVEDVITNGKGGTMARKVPVHGPVRSRHPVVKVYTHKNKRSSPAAEEDVQTPIRLAKRRKTNEVEEKTAPSNVKKPVAKGKKLLFDTERSREVAPPRSQRGSQFEGGYEGSPPRVAFSNSSISPTSQFVKFLKTKGAPVEDIKECNVLSVKEGPLFRTPKLLQCIVRGIPIVTDRWLIDSSKAGRLLPLTPYIPSQLGVKARWSQPQKTLFRGYTLYFTPALKTTYRGFHDLEMVCKDAGAKVVSKRPTAKAVNEHTIILVANGLDAEAVGHDVTCFSKDLLTNSILRGAIDLDSEEFKIAPKPAAAASAKQKGKGKKR